MFVVSSFELGADTGQQTFTGTDLAQSVDTGVTICVRSDQFLVGQIENVTAIHSSTLIIIWYV